MARSTNTIRSFAQVAVLSAAVFLSAGMLTGCDLTNNQLKLDRSGHKDMQDYRDALAGRPVDTNNARDDKGIPALQQYVAQPSASLKSMPLVSISVNQTVPLRDALYELAQQAGYDIELDPRITGSIIFSAKDKPFDEVVDRICDIANLRYKFNDHTIRIEMDTPYQKLYKIDYLAYIRKNKSSVHNDVSVVSGGGASTGSGYQMDAESEADFWGELSSNLQQILGVAETVSALKTKVDPSLTAVQQNPAPVQQVGGANATGAKPGEAGATPANGATPAAGAAATPAAPGAAGAGGGNTAANAQAATAAQQPQTTPPQAVLQVQSLPTDPNAPADPNASSQDKSSLPSFALNKQAGLISVFASDRQQKKVEGYLNTLKKSVTAQVMIEAKVLEVSLSDEYSAGIDWSVIDKLGGHVNVGFTTAGALARNVLDPAPAAASNFQFAYTGNDANALIDAISRFGTIHALASPRLTVLNNQSALLNVANNLVYFTVTIQTTSGTGGSPSETTVDSSVHNVPEGVLINVQPSINMEDQTVSLAVRPTITRQIATVNDPAVAYQAAVAGADISSPVPVMNVQEMDSVINLHSGQAIVMGGLMQDRSQSSSQSVPVLGDIPLFGKLFGNQTDKIQKTELIIFLKATIIDNGNVSETDKDLYRQFGEDRRPMENM